MNKIEKAMLHIRSNDTRTAEQAFPQKYDETCLYFNSHSFKSCLHTSRGPLIMIRAEEAQGRSPGFPIEGP